MTRPALLFTLLLACTAAPPPPPPPTPTPPPPPPSPLELLVTADLPGASALVVEADVTDQLEQTFKNIPELARLRSASRSGHAELRLTFTAGADADAAMLAVQTRLRAAQSALPTEVLPPLLRRAPDRRRAALFTLQSSQLNAAELTRFADAVRDALHRTPGVHSIDVCGRRPEQLEVTPDLTRLAAYGLALSTVVDVLRQDLGTTALAGGVRLAELRPDALADLVLTTKTPSVRLRDVATVQITASRPTCDATRVGGARLVLGIVHADEAAPANFEANIREALDAQRAALPRTVELDVPTAAPLRIAVDLEAPTDLDSALAVHAGVLEKDLLGNHIQARAYLQAPVADLPGQRHTGDLLIVPDSPEHAAKLRQDLPKLRRLGAIGSLADRDDDPQRHPLRVTGTDLTANRELAAQLAELLRTVPGVARTRTRDLQNPELVLDIQRDRLTTLAVRPDDVHTALALAFTGADVGALRTGDTTLPIVVRLPDPPDKTSALTNVTVPTTTGAPPVRLDALVTIRADLAPAAIFHEDHQRATLVELFYSDRQAREAAKTAVQTALEIPPGHAIHWDPAP